MWIGLVKTKSNAIGSPTVVTSASIWSRHIIYGATYPTVLLGCLLQRGMCHWMYLLWSPHLWVITLSACTWPWSILLTPLITSFFLTPLLFGFDLLYGSLMELDLTSSLTLCTEYFASTIWVVFILNLSEPLDQKLSRFVSYSIAMEYWSTLHLFCPVYFLQDLKRPQSKLE